MLKQSVQLVQYLDIKHVVNTGSAWTLIVIVF